MFWLSIVYGLFLFILTVTMIGIMCTGIVGNLKDIPFLIDEAALLVILRKLEIIPKPINVISDVVHDAFLNQLEAIGVIKLNHTYEEIWHDQGITQKEEVSRKLKAECYSSETDSTPAISICGKKIIAFCNFTWDGTFIKAIHSIQEGTRSSNMFYRLDGSRVDGSRVDGSRVDGSVGPSVNTDEKNIVVVAPSVHTVVSMTRSSSIAIVPEAFNQKQSERYIHRTDDKSGHLNYRSTCFLLILFALQHQSLTKGDTLGVHLRSSTFKNVNFFAPEAADDALDTNYYTK